MYGVHIQCDSDDSNGPEVDGESRGEHGFSTVLHHVVVSSYGYCSDMMWYHVGASFLRPTLDPWNCGRSHPVASLNMVDGLCYKYT